MANTIGWGEAHLNNSIEYGDGGSNSIGFGSIYSSSNFGQALTDGVSLGEELITNGDFENGSSNWAVLNSDVTYVNGTAILENQGRVMTTGIATLGNTYKVVINFNDISGDGIRIYYGLGASIDYSLQDIIENEYKIEETIEFLGNTRLYIYSVSVDTYAIIERVSVKEVL